MKMLKNNLFEKLFKIASLLICTAFLSCSGLNGVGEKNESSSGNANGQAYLSAVSFGSERTIMPSTGFNLVSDIGKFTLDCAQQGEGTDLPSDSRTWETDTESGSSAYYVMSDDLQENKIPLVEGTTWEFTIKAYKNASDESPVLQKTVTQAIVAGNNRVKFGVLEEGSGKGTLSVTMRFPSEGVNSVKVKLDPVSNEGYSVAEKGLLITGGAGGYSEVLFEDSPKNGKYLVTFTFTVDYGAGAKTHFYTEFVRIVAGLRSEATCVIEKLDALYPLHFNFKGGQAVATALPGSYSTYGSAIPMPEVQSRTGATFDGWYADSAYKTKVTELAAGSKGEKTFYAKWKYDWDGSKLFAGGANLIIVSDGGDNSVTRAYFDSVDEDHVVLAGDGSIANVTNCQVFGGKAPDNSYAGGITDHITLQSGIVSSITAEGTDGSVTIQGGMVTENVVAGANETVNLEGGTIKGNVVGTGGTTTVKVSGTPVVGNGKDLGIYLSTVKNNKLVASSLENAGSGSITVFPTSSIEGTVVATFSDTSDTAYATKFTVIHGGRIRVVKVSGSDIKIEGGLSLPNNFTEESDGVYVLGEGNVTTTEGTIFSIFAKGGYFTLDEQTDLSGAAFDMGIPLDANFKENGYDAAPSTTHRYRYIQFTSASGNIDPSKADAFLQKVRFHKINNQPIKVRINLETVPLSEMKEADVVYFDGSFYKAVNAEDEMGTVDKNNDGVPDKDKDGNLILEYKHDDNKHHNWDKAYNQAKAMEFNGLHGYLMTITTEAENKFIYDQVFSKKGITPGNAAAWLGATRSINQSGDGWDGNTWSVDNSKLNDAWYWACGPEAGEMFYDKATRALGGKVVSELFYENWNGGEPNNNNTEYCAQYCGTYIWNDLNKEGKGSSPYHVYNYVVEFSPYENAYHTESPSKRVLHAEHTYGEDD